MLCDVYILLINGDSECSTMTASLGSSLAQTDVLGQKIADCQAVVLR